MTASAYLVALKARCGVTLRLQKNGRLVTSPKGRTLPASAKQMLVGFRRQVIAFLKDGTDDMLDLAQSRAVLEDLGFQALPDLDGEPLCHPEGDEVGDEILAGILSGDEARTIKRAREARAAKERQALVGDGRTVRVGDHTVIQRRGSINWR
jgi:hypothetical protein